MQPFRLSQPTIFKAISRCSETAGLIEGGSRRAAASSQACAICDEKTSPMDRTIPPAVGEQVQPISTAHLATIKKQEK